MIDLMLRFADETEAADLLGVYRREGQWLTASHSHALDVIGPLPDAVGFHVNLRLLEGEPPAGLDAHTVNPPQPARVWA